MGMAYTRGERKQNKSGQSRGVQRQAIKLNPTLIAPKLLSG